MIAVQPCRYDGTIVFIRCKLYRDNFPGLEKMSVARIWWNDREHDIILKATTTNRQKQLLRPKRTKLVQFTWTVVAAAEKPPQTTSLLGFTVPIHSNAAQPSFSELLPILAVSPPFPLPPPPGRRMVFFIHKLSEGGAAVSTPSPTLTVRQRGILDLVVNET